MTMEPMIRHEGKCVPLYLPNIDTDQIVPKKFLLRVERTGYDEALFYEWRFRSDGSEIEDFVLNRPRYRGASILIAGPNFGCGSSREHAPWALFEYGFRVIIAPGFADIFYGNCFKTGILPVILEERSVRALADKASAEKPLFLEIDVAAQVVTAGPDEIFSFTVDTFEKECLMSGMDEIAATLCHSDLIAEFESVNPTTISA